MLRAGGQRRTLHADQQQHLIAAVGNRVDGFRQHRAGACPERSGPLRDSDAAIRGQRGWPWLSLRRVLPWVSPRLNSGREYASFVADTAFGALRRCASRKWLIRLRIRGCPH